LLFPDYTYSCWLNGWRKNPSDATQPLFAIETSQYAFSLNPADFGKAGFAFNGRNVEGYSRALQSGTEHLRRLPPAELVIELQTDGRTYRAVSCKAGAGTDARRLSPARMWESGRFVQHYDFLGLNFRDAQGKTLSCTGTLDLVAWPDSLTLTASLTPVASTWTNTTLRVALKGCGTGVSPVGREEQFTGPWASGVEKSMSLTVQSPERVSPDTRISLQVTAGLDQSFPVKFEPKKDCFVASVPKIKRGFASGYTDIRDYDEFAITIDNQGVVRREVPFLLDFRSPANITGLCPLLCDKEGRPTGIPVQLSKNWHHPKMGPYLMAYASLPSQPGKTEYLLRIAYGFYGTLPSASHAQLCLIGYGGEYGNGRWDQLAIGCWGETICFDMDMSLTDIAITDVRMLMARNGLNGTKWSWTDAGWGGDWLGMHNANGEKLAFNDLKTAYLSQGPCLTDVRYAGFYGAGREVALEAQVQTLRTDDHARTLQRLKYTFNVDSKTNLLWLYKMGRTSGLVTPRIAYGNRAGLIAEQSVPLDLKPGECFVDKRTLEGDGPWWVSFPGARHTDGRNWGTGYRALVIRSYTAHIGGRTFTRPTFSLPVHHVQKKEMGLDLDLLLVAPKEVSGFGPGDRVEMDLEWITLPRIAEDYYGPNETFRKHLAENPSSWKTTYRESAGNDLNVTAIGGKVLSRYPVLIRADKPMVTVAIKGGVGFVPLRFEGLRSVNGVALYEVISGKEVKFDPSVHGNDFWQADIDEGGQTYALTYNLPLDNKPESKWILKREETRSQKP
jgi:hypothetical protein